MGCDLKWCRVTSISSVLEAKFGLLRCFHLVFSWITENPRNHVCWKRKLARAFISNSAEHNMAGGAFPEHPASQHLLGRFTGQVRAGRVPARTTARLQTQVQSVVASLLPRFPKARCSRGRGGRRPYACARANGMRLLPFLALMNLFLFTLGCRGCLLETVNGFASVYLRAFSCERLNAAWSSE